MRGHTGTKDAESLMSEISILCIACQQTQATKVTAAGHARLPRRWRREAAGPLCPSCVSARYLPGSLTVPIAGPVDGTWQAFGAACKAQWVLTTQAANWIVRELYVRDVRREATDTRLRAMPSAYLYPELMAAVPGIAPVNATALIQSVTRTYQRQRYQLLWTGQRQLAMYRYPTPAPINEQAWTLERTAGGAWLVRLRLGDAWWTVRLQAGRDMALHLRRLEQLRAGAAIRGAAQLRQHRSHTGDHRSGTSGPAGRARVRVLLTIAGLFPRGVASGDPARVLEVHTAGTDLLRASVHGRGVVLTVPADDLRQRIAAYEVMRQRVLSTLGVARRWVPAERESLRGTLEDRGVRHRRAMKTRLQQIAAAVVGCARDQGAGLVRYDDSDDTFQAPFPWQSIRLALERACDTRGLRYEYACADRAADPEVEEAEALAIAPSA